MKTPLSNEQLISFFKGSQLISLTHLSKFADTPFIPRDESCILTIMSQNSFVVKLLMKMPLGLHANTCSEEVESKKW